MDAGPLKDKLNSCKEKPLKTSGFSISHRGAPLQFPEHSRQSWNAAARMGAGVIECDTTFTKDRELVCRHSQCDLHFTTNILETELASKCTTKFTPAVLGTDGVVVTPAKALCCTSDITLAEFKSLKAKMEGNGNNNALNGSTNDGRLSPTPYYRTDLYADDAELMSLKDHIALIQSYGLDSTPEAKAAEVPLPFDGDYTREDFIQQMVDTYRAAGVDFSRVWPQSFLPDDITYWIKHEPKWAKQAIYLDERTDDAAGYKTAVASLPGLKKEGVNIVAPPIYALVNVSNGQIVPSEYAKAAKAAGLDIITWSWERDPPIGRGPSPYYYQSVNSVINNDGDIYNILDVVARQVGAIKVFADWPGTITYYANCFGLGV